MITRRNLLKVTLGALAAGAGTFVSGCEETDVYKDGIVKERYADGVRLEESSGALFGNASVKLGAHHYVLEIETPDKKVYTASVRPYGDCLEALMVAIKRGTEVRFAVRRHGCDNFREDRIGEIRVDDIRVTNP